MLVAIDTNVLVRYVTRDEPTQERAARALFEQSRVFVARTVMMEAEWVLRSVYRYSARQIAGVFAIVVDNENVVVEDEAVVRSALRAFEAGLDFADAIHLAACADYETFATFDIRLRKRAAKSFDRPSVIDP